MPAAAFHRRTQPSRDHALKDTTASIQHPTGPLPTDAPKATTWASAPRAQAAAAARPPRQPRIRSSPCRLSRYGRRRSSGHPATSQVWRRFQTLSLGARDRSRSGGSCKGRSASQKQACRSRPARPESRSTRPPPNRPKKELPQRQRAATWVSRYFSAGAPTTRLAPAAHPNDSLIAHRQSPSAGPARANDA